MTELMELAARTGRVRRGTSPGAAQDSTRARIERLMPDI
jgi:hypothetical protein